MGVSASGITSLNAQIFTKSSKKEFENRTPRSTREVRKDFSFFVPSRRVRYSCGDSAVQSLSAIIAIAISCLCLMIVFENIFSVSYFANQIPFVCKMGKITKQHFGDKVLFPKPNLKTYLARDLHLSAVQKYNKHSKLPNYKLKNFIIPIFIYQSHLQSNLCPIIKSKKCKLMS